MSYVTLRFQVKNVWLLIDSIKIKNTVHNLLEIARPDSNYILFENIKKSSNKNRNIYLYNIGDKKTVGIGCLDHSDIIIKDDSVSNNHAYINLVNYSLHLIDNKSNYGTLVLINHDIVLLLNKTFTFQVRDIAVSLTLKEKNCIFNCFSRIFR